MRTPIHHPNQASASQNRLWVGEHEGGLCSFQAPFSGSPLCGQTWSPQRDCGPRLDPEVKIYIYRLTVTQNRFFDTALRQPLLYFVEKKMFVIHLIEKGGNREAKKVKKVDKNEIAVDG